VYDQGMNHEYGVMAWVGSKVKVKADDVEDELKFVPT